MSRYDWFESDASIRATLDRRTVDQLKKLVALLPGVAMKAPRKGELIQRLEQCLMGDEAVELWNRLGPLEQSALSEAVHSDEGKFDGGAFEAKYGSLPVFETQADTWRKEPTALSLFIYYAAAGGRSIPGDLRERLKMFVPAPAPASLKTLDQIPERTGPKSTPRWIDVNEAMADSPDDSPLFQRLTEQAAFQDLRTVLRLIDQEKISVSPSTLLPSRATTTLLSDLLRERDFFDHTDEGNARISKIGPVKAFSWPLLVQAAKLASLRNGKLVLTRSGRAALEAPPAQTLRDIWKAWISKGIIDEFSRIDIIKGQKGKGGQNLTLPADRRLAVNCALAKCPAGRWVDTSEFSRYTRAEGFQFEVTRDPWSLYIADPQYGSLGYDGCGGWNILQERYLLCLLFEYAAPLGIVDVAYEHPADARGDFHGIWGTDEVLFLSRYDGLRFIRLTPLGAFILGQTDRYEAREEKPAVSLSVLPNRRIRIDQGELAPYQKLLFENFAEPEDPRNWVLHEGRAVKSIEKGARVAELRAFLAGGDPQPLPETVEGFLAAVEQRGSACVCKGTALVIECLSSEIAEVIAANSQTGKFCRRVGDRELVVATDKEKAFRDALHSIGYGMPEV